MNCKQAEQAYTVIDFLVANHVHIPGRKAGGFMIKSPFRDERTASFHVDPTGRMWTDHGDGESQGGGLVKLVQRWYGVSVSEALKIIEKVLGDPTGQDKPVPPSIPKAERLLPSIEPRCIQRLTDIKLIEYVQQRGIPESLAVKYLRECYYSIRGFGNFQALAFGNDAGGYELRYYKCQYSSHPKAITSFTGVDDTRIAVFEGFFDFLSALVYFERDTLQTDAIVLNSLTHIRGAIPTLKKYKQVNLFLDNDPAGRDGANAIKSKCEGVVSWSERIYPDHKDFNEFLTGSPP